MADSGALTFGGRVQVSFQRYLIDAAPPLPAIPTSLGAVAPNRIVDNRFAIALHEGEAVWLGVEVFSAVTLRIKVRRAAQDAEVEVDPDPGGLPAMVAGVELASGMSRLDADQGPCEIELQIAGADEEAVRVSLLDPAAFRTLTGLEAPPPARPDHGYGGWRLP